ncbi:MAG: TonB-dependent receptor [Bacteroidaceae bacterium]|nr:TonB-dependent receptor [Bacteroidaceae bacterium]
MRRSVLLAAFLSGLSLHAAAQRDTIQFGETVVTGARTAVTQRNVPMTISVIDRQKLTENYRPSLLPTLTEQVPGMFVTGRGMMGYGISSGAAGTMTIRGIGGMAQMLVLVDGLPQYAGLYGHPVADAYQTMLAERVEVLRGPASLIYGSNAMGGVMNIVTRRLPYDGMKNDIQVGWGSYGTFQSEYSNVFRQGKLAGAAGISHNSTDGHRPNSQFREGSGFLKLGYDLDSHWTAQALGNLNWFSTSNPGTTAAPLVDNDARVLRGMASAGIENRYDRTQGAVRGFISWGHHHINDGYNEGGTPRTSLYLHNDFMLGISAYQGVRLFRGNMTTVGLDWQQVGGHAWNRAMATGEETDIVRKTENDLAGYIDFRQDITPLLTAHAGLRADHHTQAGTEWIPQGGLVLHMARQAELSACVSKGFHHPTIKDLYMFRIANADLRPERMMNYELSYKQRLAANRLRIGGSIFLLDAENIIQTQMVDGRMQNINTGRLKNWGLEAEAACKALPSLELNANYSFLHMKHPVMAAPQNKLYLGADWHSGRWAVAGGLQYIGGLYTSLAPNGHKEEFWLLNLTASHRLHFNIRLFVRGENLLAQRYSTMGGFPMPRATFMGGVHIHF